MYQALYRKWRPTTFSQVVGQQHITDTLQRQVAEGRTGHAYLFTGTRGTGKTTCARILAKAINCLHPVDGAPCNQCEACRGIDEGRLLDITELDAASNNGVDNVRALREEAVYTPSVLKKRVYIIDEVHMLSTPAFNALLKILEEPPEHLVFILATTELHKVPATILSRCQRYSFKRILPHDIARQLLYIAGEEHIDLTPDGADILARMANGAMRDALSLLDQCRSCEDTLNSTAILELLGLAGGVQTAQLLQFILQRNTQDTLLLFDKLYRDGKDISALLRELSDLCRDLLIQRSAPQGGSVLLTGLYDGKTLESLASLAPGSRLIFMLEILGQTLAALGGSSLRTEAELCLMKLCDESLCGSPAALTARLERLERAAAKGFVPAEVSAPTPAPIPVPTPAAAPAPQPAAAAKPQKESAPATSAEPEPKQPERKPAPAPSQTEKSPVSAGDSDIWQRLQNRYKGALRVDKRVFLNGASGTLADGVLTVVCRDEMVKNYLDCPEVNQVLENVTAEEIGGAVRVVFTLGQVKPPARQRPDTPSNMTTGTATNTTTNFTTNPTANTTSEPGRNTAAPMGDETPREEPPMPQTPPWEASPSGTDRMNELLAEGSRLDHFNIK